MTAIHGTVSSGYEAVRDTFAENFRARGEVGAAFCAWVGDREVVSLWGGVADLATGRPWSQDTIVMVYSMTKALSATCVHHLVERGELDLDAPVARYWPEFAAAGKERVTLRMIMSHSAGLPVVEADFSLEQVLQWDPVVSALATQAPLWKPGSAHGYHLRTYGWLVGEVFKRVAGCSLGRYFAQEIAGPQGLDWYLGLPESLEPRVAPLVPPPASFHEKMSRVPKDLLLMRAATTPSNLFHYDAMWNERRLREGELPSSNSITNAAASGRFYAALLGNVPGCRILGPDTLQDALRLQQQGQDRVMMMETAFGTGFQLQPWFSAVAGPRTFGHAGAGGAIGFADPDADIAFSYTPNRLRFRERPDGRGEALARALYQSYRAHG